MGSEQIEENEGMLEISVSDPRQQGEGMNAFVSYKVNTKTDLPSFSRQNISVIRRYSDFVWLQSQFSKEFPGVIIPPLPEKQIVQKISEQFLSEEKRLVEEKNFRDVRKRSLEKFLKRAAKHHLLRQSDCLKRFLELSEGEFAEAKEEAAKAKKSKGFWQWATEASHSIQSKLGAPSDRVKTDQDEKFEEICKYINSIEPQTASVYKHTQGLVKRSRDMSQSLFQVGVAFRLLGQSESGSLGAALGQLGDCADKLSAAANTEADKEARFFEEPIKDYVRMIHAVKLALNVRNNKQITYETCVADLQSKEQKLSSYVGEDRRAEGQQEVDKAKAKVDAAKADFDLVTARIFEEVERFKRDKLKDFKRIILDFVQLQIEYNQQVEAKWRNVLPTLQALNMNFKGDESDTSKEEAQ